MSDDTTGDRLARTEARAAQLLSELPERKRSTSISLAKKYLSLAEPESRLVVTDWPDQWSADTVDAHDIGAVTAAVDALLHRHAPEDRLAAIVFDIAGRDDPELASVMDTAGQHARRSNCHVAIIVDEWAGRARPRLT